MQDVSKNGCFLDSVITRALLVCPLCKGHLSFSWIRRHRDVVQKAGIRCNSCGVRYEVVARIPVLLQQGQFADWTHPFVEMILGNNRMALDEMIQKYGAKRLKRLYSRLLRGQYRPSLLYERAVDRKLIASGARRLTKRAIAKHFKSIKTKTEEDEPIDENVRKVAELKPKTVLDQCSGGGFFLAHLLEKYKGYEQLFSFDIDYNCAKIVEGILRYYGVVCKSLPMVADARVQPFPSDFFDIVTNDYGFSHILGHTKALRETLRILKPGGQLIVREGYGLTRRYHLKRYFDFTVDELIRIQKYGDVLIDKENFLENVESQGFSVDEIQNYDDCFIAVCNKPRRTDYGHRHGKGHDRYRQ
jgi:ubiquinone/menaquinone biosynthesis C-methylase UbiE/uncharacterized protein YbaR (Trm112 family)